MARARKGKQVNSHLEIHLHKMDASTVVFKFCGAALPYLSTNNSKAQVHKHYFLTSFFLVSDKQTKQRHLPQIHLLQEQPRLPPRLLLRQPAGEISHAGSTRGGSNSGSWMTWTKFSSRNQPVKDDLLRRKHARGLAA